MVHDMFYVLKDFCLKSNSKSRAQVARSFSFQYVAPELLHCVETRPLFPNVPDTLLALLRFTDLQGSRQLYSSDQKRSDVFGLVDFLLKIFFLLFEAISRSRGVESRNFRFRKSNDSTFEFRQSSSLTYVDLIEPKLCT